MVSKQMTDGKRENREGQEDGWKGGREDGNQGWD